MRRRSRSLQQRKLERRGIRTKQNRDRYVAIEWGAGWGPWAGGRGIRCLRPENHVLIQAAIGPEAGHARWPKYDDRNRWSDRPIREGSPTDMDYPSSLKFSFSARDDQSDGSAIVIRNSEAQMRFAMVGREDRHGYRRRWCLCLNRGARLRAGLAGSIEKLE